MEGKFVSIAELRDILRRAAALLCKTTLDQCAIVQHLVGIPFAVFTKQSIKLGISLWLGVINENPRMEPRIVAVIAERWEETVRNRTGVFSDKLQYYHECNLSRILLTDQQAPGSFLCQRGIRALRQDPLDEEAASST